MTLLIARHGQTDWNLVGRWQSTSDIPLNAQGRNQAARLAVLLKEAGYAPCRLISSPLSRAWETAQILGEEMACAVETEPALTELDLGDFEGQLESELRARDPVGYDAWRDSCCLEAAPGGETIHDVAARVGQFVAGLDDHSGDIVVVGHQGVNMAIKAQLSDCFSRECLASFRQKNDEIDLWQLRPARSLRQLRINDD
jgi:broad specificity phosphatase PhoE